MQFAPGSVGHSEFFHGRQGGVCTEEGPRTACWVGLGKYSGLCTKSDGKAWGA